MSVQVNNIKDIADAIRTKEGSTAKIDAYTIPLRIMKLPQGVQFTDDQCNSYALTMAELNNCSTAKEVQDLALEKISKAIQVKESSTGTIPSNTFATRILGLDMLGPVYGQGELPFSAEWNDITYGSGKFVAISHDNNTVRNEFGYSTDGITWSKATISKIPTVYSTEWIDVGYGNNKFVSIPYNGSYSAYSSDGIVWVGNKFKDWKFNSMAYGNGKFVAVADAGNSFLYSSDGMNWSIGTMPASANWFDVTYGGGKFVAVSTNSSSSSNYAAYSTDGIKWTRSTLPYNSNWLVVSHGDSGFVAISGGSSRSAFSSDGITWKATSMPVASSWRDCCYGNGKFVAISSLGGNAAYSEDGLSWSITSLPTNGNWEAITYGEGKFVIVGRNTNKSCYSSDGIKWI